MVISDWSPYVCSSDLDVGLPHQRLCFETLDIGNGKVILGCVEQASERTFERVGCQRDTQRCRLKQQRQAGQRPFLLRSGRKVGQTIGRSSWWERVGQYVVIAVVPLVFKKKIRN